MNSKSEIKGTGNVLNSEKEIVVSKFKIGDHINLLLEHELQGFVH
jgi:hypothetical protein